MGRLDHYLGDMDFKPEELLGDAIEAARRALRDLDAEQVPASLKRVVGYSGGTLPPPFARSLLAELDDNEFLRSKALQAWKGDRPDDGDGAMVSHRFLERDTGWLLDVAAAAFGSGGRIAASGDRMLEVERDAFEAEAVSLRGRLKAARKELDRLETALREASKANREPVREEAISERRVAEEREQVKSDHLKQVGELKGQLSELGDEIRSVRETARLERQLRAEAEASHRVATTAQSVSMDAEALAEQLDVIAALAAATGPGGHPSVAAAADPGVGLELRYPTAVRPDSAEGVEWLLSVDSATVLVDGYNLGFLLAGRLDPPRARLLVSEVLGRLTAATRQIDVVAVFDSEIEEVAEASQRGRGIEIIYSSGRSADDEIVDRARAAISPVVITNDRDVRHRAEEAGAVVLWSDALVEWSRSR